MPRAGSEMTLVRELKFVYKGKPDMTSPREERMISFYILGGSSPGQELIGLNRDGPEEEDVVATSPIVLHLVSHRWM